jgi:hypothetical protein
MIVGSERFQGNLKCIELDLIVFLKLMTMGIWNYKILKAKFTQRDIMAIALNFMQLEDKLKDKRRDTL